MEIQIISPAQLAHLLRAPIAKRLIDVRSPAEFSRVHVKGAQSIPLDKLTADAVFAGGNPSPIYLICQAGTRSATACQRLMQAGITDVYSVEGGTTAAEKAGLPVERRSGGTISLERQVRIGAGFLMLLGIALARWVHPAFAGLSVFVGAGLMFAGITDYCGMGMLLAKMPWNR